MTARVAVDGDVNDDGDVGAAIEAARSLGPLSLVVNVAGGGLGGGRTVGRGGALHDKDAFVATMEMNAFGTFNVSRLAAAAMADERARRRRPARRHREHRLDRRASKARPARSRTRPRRPRSSA